MSKAWSPDSWQSLEARQQPDYPDPAALTAAESELASYPALTSLSEAGRLKAQLAQAQAGRAFFVQGGDCAESFAEFSPANIDSSFRLIAAIADTLGTASGLPVIASARMAGQFAKPRSTGTEVKGGESLPAYRGDIVNGIGFDPASRAPDPARMFRAYAQAYATLSRLRTLAHDEGTAVYTCHEALLLPYEQALVRTDAESGAAWGSSAHFLWIGDRTRFPGSAHVEFARGLTNPLGIKCGPSLTPGVLLQLLEALNPDREAGRITLISRMGAGIVSNALPPLIRAVEASGHPVLWSCDPMHGNTVKSANGYKTRPFERILDEVRSFCAITRSEGAIPGGIHIEMTGQDVTECTGGSARVTEQDLGDRYHTHCDPRLNPAQAMELAQLVATLLAR
ncbi:MAG TPA: 3-deoxy-7-phosphoheptulonate synthase class II [Allosphingosinicella sp.]|nr:3-deoxy-7-phosphoheptulonate synthase class II [Allosphingosinicella sp.]